MKFDFWKYQKNNNYRYKKISFITIMIYLFYICMRSNEENSSKNYYSKYLCNLLTLDKEKECQIEFYNNYYIKIAKIIYRKENIKYYIYF